MLCARDANLSGWWKFALIEVAHHHHIITQSKPFCLFMYEQRERETDCVQYGALGFGIYAFYVSDLD